MRKVHCKKYGEELEGLDAPPLPGPAGQQIFETISKKAWLAWQDLQTTLINEKHLNLRDRDARKYLTDQREHFFANEDVDRAEGFTPKSS